MTDPINAAFSPQKYPHTSALLNSFSKDARRISGSPSDTSASDGSANGDETNKENEQTSNTEDSAKEKYIVQKVVALIQDEDEDELKDVLKDTYGISDDQILDQHVLDLMHKHKDDVSGVPFLFLTPTKRPISRPSSRASTSSTHSYRISRPDTPTATSPLSLGFRRPHTPLSSPLGGGHSSSYISIGGGPRSSPSSSPTPVHAHLAPGSQPSSPLSSPRFLNAKAAEFRPSPGRTHSSSAHSNRSQTPSPDLWGASSSPLIVPTRLSSNLAIAAPLVADSSGSSPRLRASTPSRPTFDDEDDEFSPFSVKNAVGSSLPKEVSPEGSGDSWPPPSSNESLSPPSANFFDGPSSEDDVSYGSSYPMQYVQDDFAFPLEGINGMGYDHAHDPDNTSILTEGMTPFDVLLNVFGSSVSPTALEEALAQSGYDFESAMTLLVEKSMPPSVPAQVQMISPAPRPIAGNRVVLIPRDTYGQMRPGPGYGTTGRESPLRSRSPAVGGGGNRVCRYFLQGECRRADCRFSHDIERALCRFWLRGQCAKGESCEFMHTLPQDLHPSLLTAGMMHMDLGGNGSPHDGRDSTPPRDDFPSLAQGKSQYPFPLKSADPSRTRFAQAVKKTPGRYSNPQFPHGALGNSHVNSPIRPRPSPRLKLRPPSLLPTLPTGDSINALYMSYRALALRLGADRNKLLSRAAEAWRNGDAAGAKRFSREAQELNKRMKGETAEAASKLVKDRARVAVEAVRGRDPAWTDDPGDRSTRGKICGGGYGVCLGIAASFVGGSGDGRKMTPEEKTEVLLDLHGLHAGEAAEVVEEFLLALEQENFFGLAYLIVGEGKHTGTQDPARGASKARLADGVKEWLFKWGYPWSERDGIVCVDPLTHTSE